MKFVHCADLHLDSKIDTLPLDSSKTRREEVLNTFERLCDYATKNGVAAVIIAGDMFDASKVTLKTRERVLSAIEKNSEVDFLYLSGNHDEDGFINSIENAPQNLKVFGDSWTSFIYEDVVISGIKLNSVNAKSAYDSLKLLPKNFNVVTLHGQIAGYNNKNDAEIISLPKLKDKNIDYLALGHIHSYSFNQLDNRTKYAYSGCLDGRGFDETGDKGFILLEVDKGRASYSFVNFSSRDIYEVEYVINGENSFYQNCNEIIADLISKYSKESLIKVVLKGEHAPDYVVDKDNFSERLNREFFFAKVYDKTTLKVSTDDYQYDKSVKGEFVRAVLESDLEEQEKKDVIMAGLNALKGEEI